MSEADQQIQELMNDALDGRLSPEGMRRLERMLRTDPALRSEWESMKRLHQMLRTVETPRVPENFARRIRERIESLADGAPATSVGSPRSVISHDENSAREPSLFERLGLVRVAAVFLAFCVAGTILYEEISSRPVRVDGTEAAAPMNRQKDNEFEESFEQAGAPSEASSEGRASAPTPVPTKKAGRELNEDKGNWTGAPTEGDEEIARKGEGAPKPRASGNEGGFMGPRGQRRAPALLRLESIPDSRAEEARLLTYAPPRKDDFQVGTITSALPPDAALLADPLHLFAGKLNELRSDEILSPAFARLAEYQERILALHQKAALKGPATGAATGDTPGSGAPAGERSLRGIVDGVRGALGRGQPAPGVLAVAVEPSVYLVRGSKAPAIVEKILQKAPEPQVPVGSEAFAFAFFSLHVLPTEATAAVSLLESEPGLSVRSLGGTWPTESRSANAVMPGGATSADLPSDRRDAQGTIRVLLVVFDS